MLISKGIHPAIAGYIANSYINAPTTLQICNEEIPIKIRRGVKQGDRLSPLLFNVIIDPILRTLNEHPEAYEMGEHKMGALGFADDIIILAKNKAGAGEVFSFLVESLSKLKMSISIPKCGVWKIRKIGKSWGIENPNITYENETILFYNEGATFKYLGITYTM